MFSKKNAVLLFPNGKKFEGYGIGKKATVTGEICFNTAISGYQEILTDPSYLGQIVTFTFPHIGNVGTNAADIESKVKGASGLIIRENIVSPADSNYRNQNSLNDWLVTHNLTGISGIDTRSITKLIRSEGAVNVAIIYQNEITAELIEQALKAISDNKDLNGAELASKASKNEKYSWGREGRWQQEKNSYSQTNEKKIKVVAIDYGSKLNILRNLADIGCEVEVVPAESSFEEILSKNPDGVFLSNGPGDPAETAKYSSVVIKKIVQSNIPLFGICLGHQLLALAFGAKTTKMHQGHRGANHPVLNLKSNKVEITSQNHGFCVELASLPANIEVTHLSLFDQTVEGIKIKDKNAFSVQYHPESSPGPNDSDYLFQEFINQCLNKL